MIALFRPRFVWLHLAGAVIFTAAIGVSWYPAGALGGTAITADDAPGWPQFGGPDGQGHVVGPIPTSWSDSGNTMWSVPIPGRGWSSPVILDGQVWVTTAIVDNLGNQSLHAIAVDMKTGAMRHDVELFTIAKPKPKTIHERNTFASPTPVLEKGKLYAAFGCYGTACVDTTTGQILWKNDSLVIDHETGPAASPLLYKDRIILSYDGMDDQYAVALSTATGEVLWKAKRHPPQAKTPPENRAFSTPLVINVDGKDQVVLPGAFWLYSYDPMSGKEIWRAQYGGFAVVPRPLFAHGLVYVCTGFTAPEIMAVRPDGQGDVTKTHIVWRFRKNAPHVPSPVIVGDRLFMVSDMGIATCLEAKTGSVLWTERLGGTFSASFLACGNTLYAFEDGGTTVLFEAADSYKELGRNKIAGIVQATPAVAEGCLFIRTDKQLMRVGQ